MQAIDILRDELHDPPASFERCQRVVRVVRARHPHPAEAGDVPRPAALARMLVADGIAQRLGECSRCTSHSSS